MQSTEKWLPVVGYEDLYEVSTHGRVRRTGGGMGAIPGRILSLETTDRGRKRAALSNGKSELRRYFVHRLVLAAFVGPAPEGMVCCHKDDDPSNNHLDNLRWGTQSENINEMFSRKRSHWNKRDSCKFGHKLVAPNLVEWKRGAGGGSCKACERARGYARGRNLELTQDLRDEKYRDVMNGIQRRVTR